MQRADAGDDLVAHAPSSAGRSGPAGLNVPTEKEQRPVWHKPLSQTRPHPAFWLLGAHGGAAVSTLDRAWAPAADALGGWPAADSYPNVVICARTHRAGLSAAHVLLRQAAAHQIGQARLLGLVTVVDHDGSLPATLRRQLELVEELAPQAWRVPFIPDFRCLSITQMPQWSPRDEPAPEQKRFARRADPTQTIHPELAEIGSAIFIAARAAISH
ncbi:DUF6668 family protein [Nocardia sp. XZ_19_231]|uniref:DUF6668 family protein n=1 Tax=Nocardia sp. XZ_19_231 TaxID=2769252 RepID=UPI00188F6013|nr:DUF6668 family protein [Nocardia sp. XZ_19_231]